MEIWCTMYYLRRTNSNQVIVQAIRKSLKREANQVLVGADMDNCEDDIMKRLENVFGNVSSGESIFREFYTANQKQTESVVSWALRLEGILKWIRDM